MVVGTKKSDVKEKLYPTIRKLLLYLLVSFVIDLLYVCIRYIITKGYFDILAIYEELFFIGIIILGASLIVVFGGFPANLANYEGHAHRSAWTNRKFNSNLALKDLKNTTIDIGKDTQFVFFFGLFNTILFSFIILPYFISRFL